MAIGFNFDETTELREFAGTDLWVKCYNRACDWEEYIRILECVGFRAIYTAVPDFFLDNHTLEMATRDEALEEVELEHRGSILQFDIIHPMDVATTQEVIDTIKSCSPTPF